MYEGMNVGGGCGGGGVWYSLIIKNLSPLLTLVIKICLFIKIIPSFLKKIDILINDVTLCLIIKRASA